MIFIDRYAVPIPEVLDPRRDSPAQREFHQAMKFYSEPIERRRQSSFLFKVYRDRSVRDALMTLFHGKCAYCESPIDATSPPDIDMYRPKGGVIGAKGEHYPDHYWWLANDWTNLYPVCIDCNRPRRQLAGEEVTTSGKGGRFPIADESKRAPLLANWQQLEAEEPLLLDPCKPDVENHLVFSDDGRVYSNDIRGQTTIQVLGLNREGLVKARRLHAERIQRLCNAYVQGLGGYGGRSAYDIQTGFRPIEDTTRASEPYAALARQLVARVKPKVDEHPAVRAALGTDPFPAGPISPSERQKAKISFESFQARSEDYSLEQKKGLDKYHEQIRRIERIEVRDLKAISHLTFDVTGTGGNAPWLMLLGENASGKSTVLQSLALALIGERYFDRLRRAMKLDLAGMVRQGCAFGEIAVYITGMREPRRLRIGRRGRPKFSGRGAQMLVLGYGPTRLLPRRGIGRSFGDSYARVENLFDPFIPLVNAQTWLQKLDKKTFDYVARSFKSLLELRASETFVRHAGKVVVSSDSSRIPLERLCDGYQSVIALFADILEIVMRRWPTPEMAEGVVLLDEVGNHLHPAWKMRFVSAMRKFMPRMQVIATTHEPLCLRGLLEDEIAVLKRGPRGRISLVPDLPSIEGLRVDQILTSEHFGLQSTVDPALHEKIERYYALLRKPTPTAQEQAEIAALRNDINERQRLGKTERERMLLGVIDKFLAERAALRSATARQQLQAATMEKLAEIWDAAPT